MSRNKKRKKFHAKNHQKCGFLDTLKAVDKSSLQKFLPKSFNYFSENRKNHKTSNCFSIFAYFPNWSFRLIERTFHSSTLDY